jgi:hypothetical protein
VLEEGYKLDDKSLRNEICILVNYVAACPESHRFFLDKEEDNPDSHSFLDVIQFYATHDELGSNPAFVGDTVDKFKPILTTREEDVEFKKLLWTCILYVVRDPENIQAHQSLMDKDFVSAILMYIESQATSPTLSRWQSPQLKEIQIHGLQILSSLINLIPEHFH